MALSNWPSLTDDSGTKTDGTIIDKSVFDAIKASIEDDLFSAANPTITAENVIDEVKTARGTKASLDARLDVSLNEDGTPKANAANFPTADFQASIPSRNIALNGELEDWTNGASAAPDEFVLAGAGATIVRTGAGEADTFTFGAGTYAAKITRAGADVTLTQSVVAAADITKYGQIKSGPTGAGTRKIAVAMKGKTSTVSHLRIVVDDGVLTSESAYHTGGGTEEHLSVVHTISSTATKLDVRAEVNNTDAAAYVGGFVFVESTVVPTDWPLLSREPIATATRAGLMSIVAQAFAGAKTWAGLNTFNGKFVSKIGAEATAAGTPFVVLNVQHASVGNVGAGIDDLMSYALPADSLNVATRGLIVIGWGQFANGASNKDLYFKWGAAAATTLLSGSATVAGWLIITIILSTGADTQDIKFFGDNGDAAAKVRGTQVAGAENDGAAITLKFQGQSSAAGNNEVVQEGMIVLGF